MSETDLHGIQRTGVFWQSHLSFNVCFKRVNHFKSTLIVYKFAKVRLFHIFFPDFFPAILRNPYTLTSSYSRKLHGFLTSFPFYCLQHFLAKVESALKSTEPKPICYKKKYWKYQYTLYFCFFIFDIHMTQSFMLYKRQVYNFYWLNIKDKILATRNTRNENFQYFFILSFSFRLLVKYLFCCWHLLTNSNFLF